MQSEIIRETRKVYIRRKVEQEDRKMTLRMITENRIEGLLPCEIRHMDGESWLYYEITGLHNLRDLYEGRLMESGALAGLIIGLEALEKSLADFFVPARQLLLSPEEIYVDVETGTCYFQIGPGERENEAESLLDYLITVMDHEDETFTDRVYEAQSHADKGFPAIEELAETCKSLRNRESAMPAEEEEEPTFLEEGSMSLWDEEDLFPEEEQPRKTRPIKDLLKKNGKRRIPIPKWAITIGAALICLLAVYALGTYLNMHTLAVIALLLLVVAAFLLREVMNRVQFGKKAAEVPFRKENTGDTSEAEDFWDEEDPEMEALFQKKEPEKPENGKAVHQTVYMEDGERPLMLCGEGDLKHLSFQIEGEMLTLGQSPEYADLVVPDPTVSRLHARIYRDEEGCRLRDLGSLNGTFRNGKLLPPEEDEEILPGDELLFGRCAFTFR